MADTDSLDEPLGPDMWDAAVRKGGRRRRTDATGNGNETEAREREPDERGRMETETIARTVSRGIWATCARADEANERDVPTQSGVAVPEDAWEYWCRKSQNNGKGDAAFNTLAYVPVCTHQPVCSPKCEKPTFMWTKKGQ